MTSGSEQTVEFVPVKKNGFGGRRLAKVRHLQRGEQAMITRQDIEQQIERTQAELAEHARAVTMCEGVLQVLNFQLMKIDERERLAAAEKENEELKVAAEPTEA